MDFYKFKLYQVEWDDTYTNERYFDSPELREEYFNGVPQSVEIEANIDLGTFDQLKIVADIDSLLMLKFNYIVITINSTEVEKWYGYIKGVRYISQNKVEFTCENDVITQFVNLNEIPLFYADRVTVDFNNNSNSTTYNNSNEFPTQFNYGSKEDLNLAIRLPSQSNPNGSYSEIQNAPNIKWRIFGVDMSGISVIDSQLSIPTCIYDDVDIQFAVFIMPITDDTKVYVWDSVASYGRPIKNTSGAVYKYLQSRIIFDYAVPYLPIDISYGSIRVKDDDEEPTNKVVYYIKLNQNYGWEIKGIPVVIPNSGLNNETLAFVTTATSNIVVGSYLNSTFHWSNKSAIQRDKLLLEFNFGSDDTLKADLRNFDLSSEVVFGYKVIIGNNGIVFICSAWSKSQKGYYKSFEVLQKIIKPTTGFPYLISAESQFRNENSNYDKLTLSILAQKTIGTIAGVGGGLGVAKTESMYRGGMAGVANAAGRVVNSGASAIQGLSDIVFTAIDRNIEKEQQCAKPGTISGDVGALIMSALSNFKIYVRSYTTLDYNNYYDNYLTKYYGIPINRYFPLTSLLWDGFAYMKGIIERFSNNFPNWAKEKIRLIFRNGIRLWKETINIDQINITST